MLQVISDTRAPVRDAPHSYRCPRACARISLFDNTAAILFARAFADIQNMRMVRVVELATKP